MDQNKMQRGDTMELNFEGLEFQKCNITTDRAQTVDQKKAVIRLIIMFTPRIIVIKMSKMAYFLHFLVITGRNQSQFGQNI